MRSILIDVQNVHSHLINTLLLEYLTLNEMEAKFKANEIIPVLPMSQNGIIIQNGELKKFA